MFVARLLALVPILLSVSAVFGWGQALPRFLDTVVVTATGEERSLEEVNAAVTVLEREDLEHAGTPSLAEALRRVPGAILLRSGLDTGVSSLFLRGSNTAHTLVLLDGVRLNSPFFGGYDFGLPLVGTLERAEVARGPYSALYGGDAIGGVVQLVTRIPTGSSWSGVVEAGGEGWRRFEAVGSMDLDGLGLTVAAASREGTGPLDNDDFRSRSGLVRATWKAGSTLRAGFLIHHADSATEIPFSGSLATPRRETESRELVMALPLRWDWDTGSSLEVVPTRVERELRFSDPDDAFGMTASQTTASSSGLRAMWRQGVGRHRVTVGAEWRQDQVDDGSNFGINLDDRRIDTGAVFVQDSFTIAEKIEVLIGGRLDRSRTWGSNFSPRATLGWREGAWRIWSSFGEGFRAPALGELYYPFAGNPDLQPERSRSWETGVSTSLLGGNSQLQMVAFVNRTQDLVEFDFATYRFANVSDSRQRGLEGGWWSVLGSGSLQVSATWLEAEDTDGTRLLRRPRWSGSVALHYPVGRVTAEAALVWVGSRPDVDPVSFGRVEQPAFVTANAAVTVPVTGPLSLRVRIENIADRNYEEVRGYPAPGRRVMVGLLASRP